jgi:hypothetical protein
MSRLGGALLHYLVITLHFLLALKLIHLAGDPLQVPPALQSLNRFLMWGPENFVCFVFEVLWIGLIVCTYLGMRYAAGLVKRDSEPFKRGFSLLLPLVFLSLITLAIIPLQSTKGLTHDTIMTEGAYMSFPEFVHYMTDATFMALIALSVLLFPFLFFMILFSFKSEKYDPGMGMFFLAIVLGIGVALLIGFLGVPLIESIHGALDGIASLFAIFGIYGALSAGGVLLGTGKKSAAQGRSTK